MGPHGRGLFDRKVIIVPRIQMACNTPLPLLRSQSPVSDPVGPGLHWEFGASDLPVKTQRAHESLWNSWWRELYQAHVRRGQVAGLEGSCSQQVLKNIQVIKGVCAELEQRPASAKSAGSAVRLLRTFECFPSAVPRLIAHLLSSQLLREQYLVGEGTWPPK